MQHAPSYDANEAAKFSAMAERWWDPHGPFRPLHAINPLRIGFIRDEAVALFPPASEAKPLAGLSLLDIGCGGGLLSEPMARLGADVTGIDAAEKNIAIASLHAEKSNLAIAYRHAMAETLAAEGKQFHIVLSLEVVEHVADVESFLAASCQLVKPGGLLVLATISRTVQAFMLAIVGAEYIMRWLPRGTHDWQRFLKPSELAGGLRANSMELRSLRGMTYSPFSGWKLSEKSLDVNYLLSARKPA